ncbi:hypothetical protein BXT86_00245 [candidate division WOR-3 bacterium 4484_100]|uniref:DUF503 domain-containing protein n=1 Tax=candidate division WOR-3 bacterium 4484_100 TaxID=1936077 RepID=A0A1V4QI10_UNCW3|nr:MAG: hypothetical protein BXT86_00245 [candidate division WOR-3 bacterium 4484_100]
MADNFFIGRCAVDLFIENSHSLKEKRRIVSSVKERLKNHYNVSVCEFGDLSLWQRAQLGIITCANDKVKVDTVLKSVLKYLEKNHFISLLNFELQIIS